MQQTKTYKLNLIESSDTFSPNPLNENMEKLEAIIAAGANTNSAEAQARAEGDAALDQRLKVFEAHRFALGIYRSGNDKIKVSLDFTPRAVFVHALNSDQLSGFIYQGEDSEYYGQIVENGFEIAENTYMNYHGAYFAYIAFV